MARPKSEAKRVALLTAATAVIAADGVGASTARIARTAGVAEGTLFTYFADKDALLNAVYLFLKGDLRDRLADLPADGDLRHRLRAFWERYVAWGASDPEKRRALGQLTVSDRITAESRAKGDALLRETAPLPSELVSATLDASPSPFASALLAALADTTMQFVADDPERAETYTRDGFEALWTVLASRSAKG